MTLLSRYIAQTYIRMFGLCFGSFASIYIIIDIIEKVGRFTRSGGKPLHIMFFFLWKLPEIASQIIPLAVLMATLLSVGSLARTSELTAMRSSGMGLFGISSPILGIAIITSIFNLMLTEIIVPYSFERMRYIEEVQIHKKSPSAFFRQGTIWYRAKNSIVQAKLFDPATITLKGIVSWQVDSEMRPLKRLDATQGSPSTLGWQLQNVVVRRFNSGNLEETRLVNEQGIPLELSVNDLKVVGKLAENMGFMHLRTYCRKLTEGGYNATRYLTLLHSKLAAPFSPLVMAFLGIPFALKGGRTSGIAVGIGMSLGLGLSYFIINAFLTSFGQAGVIPPIVAAWAANMIFSAAGIWLALTLDR